MFRILVIDDDDRSREGVAGATLARLGHDVVVADPATAIGLLGDGEHEFDVVIAAQEPTAPAAAIELAPAKPLHVPHELVWLARPLSPDVLIGAIDELERRIAVRQTLADAERALVEQLDSPIIGTSPAIRAVHERIAVAAPTDVAVLITGESGTGKELVARTLHRRSRRRDAAFVVVNCAAIPEGLVESELFGHERGAFTGALATREGRFAAADRGTLFLDEIDALAPAAQAKILRVLQDGRFYPVGAAYERAVDVRLITASNADLRALVDDGTFREDLYYRIKVLELEAPPLRERAGDLAQLVTYFLLKYAPVGRRPLISPVAWAALCQHPFPGNVRELEHAIQHALVMSGGDDITLEHLPRELFSPFGADGGHGPTMRPLSEAVREFEREYLRRALELANGNKSHAARMLGMSRKNLWDKLRRTA